MADTEIDTAASTDEGGLPEPKERLNLEVKIDQPSACQRHVTVTISRDDIERYRTKAFDDLRTKAAVPGFRPGRAPRKLVQSRFKDEVSDQIKSSLLMDSLTQINDEYQLTAISEPSLDLEAVDIPDDGPMTFEFDLEVRPEFDLPQWRGLHLERPEHQYSESEIDRYTHKLLSRYGEKAAVPGPLATGDLVGLNISVRHEGAVVATLSDQHVEVKPIVSFQDGRIDGFGRLMVGASVGETRVAKVKISRDSSSVQLQDKEVDVELQVTSIERVVLPRLDRPFLDRIGGFENEHELRDAVASELDRQLKYHQQQRIRQQITAVLTASAKWELPQEMLRRQARREIDRAVLELQAAGFSNDAIKAHSNDLRQNALASTARALKEHFILERIAEDEKIDAAPTDFDDEVARIAEQQDESPRRIRARLEKKGQMDSLRNQIIERKVIELIESAAVFSQVPFEPKSDNTAALEVSLGGTVDESEIPEAKYSGGPETLPSQPDHH